MPLSDQKLQAIVESARDSQNTHVTEALSHELQNRKREEEEVGFLFTQLSQHVKLNSNVEESQEQVLKKLRQDLDLTNYLNTTILKKEYKPGDSQYHVTYPLKFNKMAIAIEGAIELTFIRFSRLLDGRIVNDGYEYLTQNDDITVLGSNTDTIYGNSKGTFLKTAALTTLLVGDGKNHLYEANFLPSYNADSWLDVSVIAHVTPLPESIDLRTCLVKDYSKYTYLFDNYSSSSSGFAFIHSRYAFGGHRNESRYPNGKPFGPEDCSSFVAKLSGSKVPFSTIDQLYHYRNCLQKNNEASESIPDPTWVDSSTSLEMTTLFDAKKIRDPQRDIQPGLIYVHHTPNGDHTGIVLGLNSDGKDSKVVIMAYGRNMPEEEGLGIQQFPLEPDPATNRQVMFLSCKPKF